MPETQREPVPRNDGGELDTALAFLRFARHCALKKADGLSDEQLRRPLVATGTSILGLIRHLAVGERYWFGHYVAGEGDDDAEWDFEMAVPSDLSADDVLADYRAAIAESDAVIEAVPDMDTPTKRPVLDEPRTLRWVLAHMTSETARHVGHADILREQLDGTTGR